MASSFETKRERRLAARADRQRQAETGRRRSQQRKRLSVVGLIVLVLAVLAGGGYLISQSLSKPAIAADCLDRSTPPAPREFDPTNPGRTVPDEGQRHVNAGSPLRFEANPPTSGNHYASPTPRGVYTEARSPGNWVHSLEHGYIVVLYCPSDSPELVQQLRQFYESAPRSTKYAYQKLVVTPYDNMKHRLAIVAWNHIDEMDRFDSERLLAFYRAYVDKGPEDAS